MYLKVWPLVAALFAMSCCLEQLAHGHFIVAAMDAVAVASALIAFGMALAHD